MSFEAIQFRVAEALLVLVLFNPKLAYGFVIGTFIANWIGPFGILDGVVGASASLIAIVCMIFTRKKPLLSLIFPAIANAVIVGLMIYLMGDLKGLNVYFGIAFWVFLGEMVVMYFLGYPLYLIINKRRFTRVDSII